MAYMSPDKVKAETAQGTESNVIKGREEAGSCKWGEGVAWAEAVSSSVLGMFAALLKCHHYI